jgi:hypothetical protein
MIFFLFLRKLQNLQPTRGTDKQRNDLHKTEDKKFELPVNALNAFIDVTHSSGLIF